MVGQERRSVASLLLLPLFGRLNEILSLRVCVQPLPTLRETILDRTPLLHDQAEPAPVLENCNVFQGIPIDDQDVCDLASLEGSQILLALQTLSRFARRRDQG